MITWAALGGGTLCKEEPIRGRGERQGWGWRHSRCSFASLHCAVASNLSVQLVCSQSNVVGFLFFFKNPLFLTCSFLPSNLGLTVRVILSLLSFIARGGPLRRDSGYDPSGLAGPGFPSRARSWGGVTNEVGPLHPGGVCWLAGF